MTLRSHTERRHMSLNMNKDGKTTSLEEVTLNELIKQAEAEQFGGNASYAESAMQFKQEMANAERMGRPFPPEQIEAYAKKNPAFAQMQEQTRATFGEGLSRNGQTLQAQVSQQMKNPESLSSGNTGQHTSAGSQGYRGNQ